MEVVDVIIIGLGYVYRLKGKAWYKRNERGGGGVGGSNKQNKGFNLLRD